MYLQAGKKQYEEMQKNFLADPKPVVWGAELLNFWKKALEEKNPLKKLPELYSELLNYRHNLYTQYADVILPWETHREKLDIVNPQGLIYEVFSGKNE